MAGAIISFVNLKGGSGKTALTVNVAVSLAMEWSRKVLVVDLDPQGNASLWLMGIGPYVERANNRTRTVFGLLCHGMAVSECLVKAPVKNEDGTTEAELLDLLPVSYHLMLMEEEHYVKDGDPPLYLQFFRKIKTLR